jgi:hypothetical protein
MPLVPDMLCRICLHSWVPEIGINVVIMGRRLQDVKEVFTSLIEQTNKMGLEINEKKTKFMTVS